MEDNFALGYAMGQDSNNNNNDGLFGGGSGGWLGILLLIALLGGGLGFGGFGFFFIIDWFLVYRRAKDKNYNKVMLLI